MAVNFRRILVFMTLAVAVPVWSGCSREKQEEPVVKAAVATKPVPAHAEETPIKGRVIEVVGSDNFIYILMDRDGQQIWATVPAVDLEVGEEITLVDANIFKNFYSKSMQKSFDELIFANGVAGKQSGKTLAEIHPAAESLSKGN
jgi:hypothetical protein